MIILSSRCRMCAWVRVIQDLMLLSLRLTSSQSQLFPEGLAVWCWSCCALSSQLGRHHLCLNWVQLKLCWCLEILPATLKALRFLAGLRFLLFCPPGASLRTLAFSPVYQISSGSASMQQEIHFVRWTSLWALRFALDQWGGDFRVLRLNCRGQWLSWCCVLIKTWIARSSICALRLILNFSSSWLFELCLDLSQLVCGSAQTTFEVFVLSQQKLG